jgi:hypothetical protein
MQLRASVKFVNVAIENFDKSLHIKAMVMIYVGLRWILNFRTLYTFTNNSVNASVCVREHS